MLVRTDARLSTRTENHGGQLLQAMVQQPGHYCSRNTSSRDLAVSSASAAGYPQRRVHDQLWCQKRGFDAPWRMGLTKPERPT